MQILELLQPSPSPEPSNGFDLSGTGGVVLIIAFLFTVAAGLYAFYQSRKREH